MTMTPERRSLRFDNLDEVMPEVMRLLDGYRAVGNWSVGQMCHHLADVLRASVDSPASPPRDASRVVREERNRQMLESGVVPEGLKTAAPFDPPAGLDDRLQAEALRTAIAYYKTSSGPVMAHPMFGDIPRADWDRFHCHHCAHHLSFAIPR
jgi:hypothetical protein